jgi:hypothetical protein
VWAGRMPVIPRIHENVDLGAGPLLLVDEVHWNLPKGLVELTLAGWIDESEMPSVDIPKGWEPDEGAPIGRVVQERPRD